jgi:hypothetical protein
LSKASNDSGQLAVKTYKSLILQHAFRNCEIQGAIAAPYLLESVYLLPAVRLYAVFIFRAGDAIFPVSYVIEHGHWLSALFLISPFHFK